MFHRLARFGLIVAALVLLAGCATNNLPTKYTAQVKTNYLETCKEGAGDKLSATDAATYCECTYGKLESGVAFSRFRDFEDFLRSNVGNSIKTVADLKATKYSDIVDLMNSCVQSGPSAPTTSAAAATTTTSAATTSR